jgi:hypothetical protein
MALDLTYYGTMEEAEEYFAMRLHEFAWNAASASDKPRALFAARLIIDALAYKGHKASVYTLLEASPNATDEEIRAAEAAQPLEFPRGTDTEVPEAIRLASYEIAHALLDGKDPEMELEQLGITSQGFGSVRTTYSRNRVPIEHIVNGIPSPRAWHWIKPFLRDDDAIKLARVS